METCRRRRITLDLCYCWKDEAERGEKLAYGYRGKVVAAAKKGLPVNRKRMLRVMGERGLHVRSRRLRVCRRKAWDSVGAIVANQIWQSDLTKIRARSTAGWAYLVGVIDYWAREIVDWSSLHRFRIEDTLAALDQGVLTRLPKGSHEANMTITTDNGTQFTSQCFLESLGGLAFRFSERPIITRWGTALSDRSIAA